MIDDLRDESDEDNPSRIIVVPRSNRIDKEALMSHLFATTDLEKNVRVNINAIGLNGKPQVFDLKTILKEWLKFRTDTVKRRLQHRLDWLNDRLHILEGLLVAYLNIDEVIKIIRTHDKPKKELMKKFKLSEIQSNAILDIRLRQLAKLEEESILSEKHELSLEAKDIEKTLGSASRLKTLIKNELKEDLEEFGDERNRTLTEVEESKAFDAGTNAAKVMPDAKRTGTYLIQACRHMIRQNKGKFRHDCVLELVKIANDEGTTVV